jgi:hypothetical protein
VLYQLDGLFYIYFLSSIEDKPIAILGLSFLSSSATEKRNYKGREAILSVGTTVILHNEEGPL